MKARINNAVPRALAFLKGQREAALVIGTAIAYGVAIYLSASLTRNEAGVAAFAPADGLLLAVLLSISHARARLALKALAFCAGALAHVVCGDPWVTVVTLPALGIMKCAIAFHLVRYACGDAIDLSRAMNLVKFVAISMSAPVLPTVLAAAVVQSGLGTAFIDAMITRYLADSLGLLVITPTILLLQSKSTSKPPAEADVIKLFLLLTIVSTLVFAQSAAPLLFLIIPVSVLIAFRLGPRYAAIATLGLTLVSLTFTYNLLGPASLMSDRAVGVWVVQVFCFVNLLTSLAVAAELADRDRLRDEFEKMSTLASDRRKQLDAALDAMSQGICLFDREGAIAIRNGRFLEIYGLRENAVPVGTSIAELMQVCASRGVAPTTAEEEVDLAVDRDIEQELVDGRHIRISQRVLSDGSAICTYTDFTAEKRAEGELRHRSLHDPLTGLPNRSLLVDRLDDALATTRLGREMAVMLLDIDYFKSVNDNLGHAAGDELLRVTAERLRGCVRESDTVARLGGDEFAIILVDGQKSDAMRVGRRILEVMREPIMLDGKSIRVGVSIGVARPDAGSSTDAVMKSADVALYKAKRSGRGKITLFNPAEDDDACSARRLESDLSRAVDEQQFRVVYQPIVDGGSGTVVAVEALIRWQHPEFGVIAPSEFIPLAERNGLIVAIGDWVLSRACADALVMPENIRVSVNLSRAQLSDRGFVGRVAAELERTGLSPSRLEFEITETAILYDEVSGTETLERLAALGVGVVIDDFGVGQSALSCLRTLPVSRIKIDRSFMSDVAEDAKARSILMAVTSLAKTLGIKTTAEGIETEQQRMIASLAGCDSLQGYLLGRPDLLDKLVLPRVEAVSAPRRVG